MLEVCVFIGGLIVVGVLQLLETRKISALVQGVKDWKPEVTIVPKSEENYEMCYFCNHFFPPESMTSIGGYLYCKSHGRRTKDGSDSAR